MVNLEFRTGVRIVIISIVFLCNSMLSDIILGQDGNGVITHLEPKEINDDSFNGELTMLVSNNSKETIYCKLEPFTCISRTDSIIFYAINSSRGMCINEIYFFKKGSKVVVIDGIFQISFLKFPRIISLESGNSLLIKIQLDKGDLHILKNVNWDVYFDIYFALKSDIDKELVNKPVKIIKEFNNLIFNSDTINIDLRFSKFSQPDTSLYISKNERDFFNNDQSIYDSILKNFWHLPKQR